MENQRPAETPKSFERRKQDHIRLALDGRTQGAGTAGFDFVELVHEALPELNFQDISTKLDLLGKSVDSPIFISSMTAGHSDAAIINSRLAELSQSKNILMGVGSQRKQLFDSTAQLEWKAIRKHSPRAKLIGNIGLAQAILASSSEVKALVDSLEAVGLFIHLNPLQEVLQMEGTPQFAGGLKAIEKIVKTLDVPVIVKEVGCGISRSTISRLESVGVKWVDVSGKGGTHWGRIETLRAEESSVQAALGKKFWNWGSSTVECLAEADIASRQAEIWASGGVRTGVDVCKALAMGAKAVGVAQPFLRAALESEASLVNVYDGFLRELKTAMFCAGIGTISEFQNRKVWKWNYTPL